MITLIHNALTTDFITQIIDEDCVRGLAVIHEGTEILKKHGVPAKVAESMVDLFGVSGICNILGAIKMAKYLKLGPDDNVVTIATDSFDRYPSVMQNLHDRELEVTDHVLDRWFNDVFMDADCRYVLDTRGKEAKEKLFKQKEDDWLKFHQNHVRKEMLFSALNKKWKRLDSTKSKSTQWVTF
jgi:hypothetical protein